MRITLLRHATILIEFAGRSLLIDPMLDPADARPAIANTADDRRNPLAPLPNGWETLVDAAEAIIQTHLHSDHFDETARQTVNLTLPVFGLPEQEQQLRDLGFGDVRPVDDVIAWNEIELTRTGGRHGYGAVAEMLAPVSGWVLRAQGEPTFYLAGDTVWCDEVSDAIARHRPDVILLNAGGASFTTGGLIIMDATDVARARAAAPGATIAVVHLDAINHCHETRTLLRANLAALGVTGILIPDDGETIDL